MANVSVSPTSIEVNEGETIAASTSKTRKTPKKK
nr:MAG TPA: hypothetical protein [Caudoviricetes sp.]